MEQSKTINEKIVPEMEVDGQKDDDPFLKSIEGRGFPLP